MPDVPGVTTGESILEAWGDAVALEVNTLRARLAPGVPFVVVHAFAGVGAMGSIGGAGGSVASVNSKTYTITVDRSAKLFTIELGGTGGAARVWCSYESAVINIETTNVNVVASAAPTANQMGISKAAGNHNIVIKTGSNFVGANGAAWTICFIGCAPSAVVVT